MGHSPEWEIETWEFLTRVDCHGWELFNKRLCLPDFKKVQRIVPLRYLADITSAPIPMTMEMLWNLIWRVRTIDGQMPFVRATIELRKVDPHQLKIGQKFVYRENYQSLLENLTGLFGKFAISSGVSELGAYFVFGKDKDGFRAMACYIPPIIEQHNADLVIMDGIHRSYITKQLGSTISGIIVRNVAIPFPCGLHPWEDIRVIGLSEKPRDINLRYFELKKELFRDLKYYGIDG